MDTLIELYGQLTAAILWAERISTSESLAVWMRVSLLEERVTELLPASDVEGRITRRGAVRAAVKAGDPKRAQALVSRFLAEEDCPPELRAQLAEITA